MRTARIGHDAFERLTDWHIYGVRMAWKAEP